MSADHGLINLTASEAATCVAAGEVSSLQLVEACLERIEERDGAMHAWAHLDGEHARAQARLADEQRGSGVGTGPLHGVPIGIKDIIDTRDYPTEMGCPHFNGNRPQADALCVAALRAAGAIVLGKTVTTELALLTPAATVNPVNADHSPGGSSAGSAVAVADYHVPAALGTQTAGSVLRPASYCGTYGFKPSFGRLPRSGVLMQSHTLDTVGLLARSIEDVALLSDVMTVPDQNAATSLGASRADLRQILAQPVPLAPRFAFVKTPQWDSVSEDAKAAFSELIDALGDNCENVDADVLADVIEWQRIVQLAENAAYYGPLQDRSRDLLSDGLNARLDEGARVSVRDYITAVRSCDPAYARVAGVFNDFDAILAPAAPGTAPKLSEGITGSPIFNGLWTYLGMPCLSVPVLEVGGLPLGVQLVGQRGDDGRLLRTAKWLVEALQVEGEGHAA